MAPEIILLIAGLVLVALISTKLALSLIYFAQIKEYRFDRMRSQLKEDGYLRLIRRHLWSRPGVSTRNLLVVVLSLIMSYSIVLGVMFANDRYQAFHESIRLAECAKPLSLRMPNIPCHYHFYSTSGIVHIPNLSEIVAFSVLLGLYMLLAGHTYPLLAIWITQPLAKMRRQNIIQKARERVGESNAVCIAISGSYGKTTTKELLHQILSSKYHVGKTDKNLNTDVGVAISILNNLLPQTQYFIAELGGYRPGEVMDAANVFPPMHAIITPFGNQHLSLYGSRENLVSTESEVVQLVRPPGKVYISADIAELSQIINLTKAIIVTNSTTRHADIYATDIVVSSSGSTAVIAYQGRVFAVSCPLIGPHIIPTLLPIMALCIDLGMRIESVQRAIDSLVPIPTKLSQHAGPEGAMILNDTGNSSLHATLNLIKTLSMYRTSYDSRLFLVLRTILELGSEKESSYRQILESLSIHSITLYTLDPLFAKLGNTETIQYFNNEASLIESLLTQTNATTTIGLAGRLTHKSISSIIMGDLNGPK